MASAAEGSAPGASRSETSNGRVAAARRNALANIGCPPLYEGVCSVARSNGIPYSWESSSIGPLLVLSGSSAFDVLARSAWIEPGPLGHLRVGPQTPVEQRAVSGEKLRGCQLSRAELFDQRLSFAQRRLGQLGRVAAREQDAPHRLLKFAHVPRPRIPAWQAALDSFEHDRDELGRFPARDTRDQQPHELLQLSRRFRDALPEGGDLDHVGT